MHFIVIRWLVAMNLKFSLEDENEIIFFLVVVVHCRSLFKREEIVCRKEQTAGNVKMLKKRCFTSSNEFYVI